MKLLNKDEFLANELKFYFIQEKLKEGDKLPSERELAEKYGVQRVTIYTGSPSMSTPSALK